VAVRCVQGDVKRCYGAEVAVRLAEALANAVVVIRRVRIIPRCVP